MKGKGRRWRGLGQNLSVEGSQIAKEPVIMRVVDLEDLRFSILRRFGLGRRWKIGDEDNREGRT